MGSFWSRLQLTSFPSFAFSRPAATTPPTSFDTADISVRGIALELSSHPDLVITARESHFRQVPYRAGERTVGIGFVIFHALSKQPDVWNSLQQLTSEFWGRNAFEDVVLARLEEAGVPTGTSCACDFNERLRLNEATDV
jgi:hypothetical protein